MPKLRIVLSLFCCLRLLRSLYVEENHGLRTSHRLFLYANIHGLHRNLSSFSLAARGGDVVFVQ